MLIVAIVLRQYLAGNKREIQKLRRATGRENAEMSQHKLKLTNRSLSQQKKKKEKKNLVAT